MTRKRKRELAPAERERMIAGLVEAARKIAAEEANVARHLELFEKLTICKHCEQPIHRVRFCGSTIWEHVIPPNERHGPFPRTLCRIGDSSAQATPYFEQLITPYDVTFLRQLRVLP
jgi:hypothetical protein